MTAKVVIYVEVCKKSYCCHEPTKINITNKFFMLFQFLDELYLEAFNGMVRPIPKNKSPNFCESDAKRIE